MREIKENLKKRRYIPYSWIGRLSVIKMSILPQFTYAAYAIPSKIPMGSFVEINMLVLKSVWKGKEPRII